MVDYCLSGDLLSYVSCHTTPNIGMNRKHLLLLTLVDQETDIEEKKLCYAYPGIDEEPSLFSRFPRSATF